MPPVGPVLHKGTIARGILLVVKAWMPWYLRNMYPGRDLVFPRSYTLGEVDDRFAEDDIPAVVIDIPATSSVQRHGDGSHTIVWDAAIGVVASGKLGREHPHDANLYAAAVEAIILQRPASSMGVHKITLTGVTDDGIPDPTKRRFLHAAVIAFEVVTLNAVSDRLGPVPSATPPPAPYAAFPSDPVVVPPAVVTVDPQPV